MPTYAGGDYVKVEFQDETKSDDQNPQPGSASRLTVGNPGSNR